MRQATTATTTCTPLLRKQHLLAPRRPAAASSARTRQPHGRTAQTPHLGKTATGGGNGVVGGASEPRERLCYAPLDYAARALDRAVARAVALGEELVDLLSRGHLEVAVPVSSDRGTLVSKALRDGLHDTPAPGLRSRARRCALGPQCDASLAVKVLCQTAGVATVAFQTSCAAH